MTENITEFVRSHIGQSNDNNEKLFEWCCNAVNEWKPKAQYDNENEYRDDLFDYLEERNKRFGLNYIIKKEAGRGLADIGVNNRVAIEVKKDLRHKSQVDRTKGQVETYFGAKFYGVIIALVGRTDASHRNELEEGLKRLSTGRGKYKIIEKPVSNPEVQK